MYSTTECYFSQFYTRKQLYKDDISSELNKTCTHALLFDQELRHVTYSKSAERQNDNCNIVHGASICHRISHKPFRAHLQVALLTEFGAYEVHCRLRTHNIPQPISGNNTELCVWATQVGAYIWYCNNWSLRGSIVLLVCPPAVGVFELGVTKCSRHSKHSIHSVITLYSQV